MSRKSDERSSGLVDFSFWRIISEINDIDAVPVLQAICAFVHKQEIIKLSPTQTIYFNVYKAMHNSYAEKYNNTCKARADGKKNKQKNKNPFE